METNLGEIFVKTFKERMTVDLEREREKRGKIVLLFSSTLISEYLGYFVGILLPGPGLRLED